MIDTKKGAAVLLVLALAGPGCAWTKSARAARHLERGDRDFAAQKWKEASLEYKSALNLDPDNAKAVRQLGFSLYGMGAFGQAGPYLKKAQEREPASPELALKLGTIYQVAGAMEQAREQANLVLAKEPNNLAGLALLAEAAQTPEEIQQAIALIEERRTALAPADGASRVLGTLYARKKDVPKAEDAFKSAVSTRPESPDAHIALGQLALGRGALAEAEKEFRTAAELAAPDGTARYPLVDFLVRGGRVAEAKPLLLDITAKAADAFPAWIRLGDIALAEGRLDDARQAAEAAVKVSPQHPAVLTLLTRVQLARKETKEAVATARKLVELGPRLPGPHLLLANALIASGERKLAVVELDEAVRLAPRFEDAVLLRAELNLQEGLVDPVVADLESFLVQNKHSARGQVLLGQAYLRKKDGLLATKAFARFAELAPQDARGPFLIGQGLLLQGRLPEAREKFEEALRRAPAFADALSQLVAIAFAEKKPEAALARVQKQVQAAPPSGEMQFVLGRTQLARGDTKAAEAAFLHATELNPNFLAPYLELANLYGRSKDPERAAAMASKALTVDPKQPAALMLSALALQQKGDAKGAAEAYDRLLAVNAKFAPAANNLAWILAEEGKDLERAYQLAQVAHDEAPEDPYVADTLGWVLVKRGSHASALPLFQQSAAKLPQNADVLVHLGLTQAKLGQTEAARETLKKALALNPQVGGAEEARKIVGAP